MRDRIRVSLTGTQQTALVTLYGKALESRRPGSILRDRLADDAVRRIDYDFSSLRMRRRDQASAALRSKAYDRRVQRFLDDHPVCVVLHLGCGLDTRAYRVAPPSSVSWYDIDLPDIIALRRQLFPPRAGVQAVGASVTDPRLFDAIPHDEPVLVVAEGLTPYLRRADGVAMLRRIVANFHSGAMLFDGYSGAGVWVLQRYPPVKASGRGLTGASTTLAKSKGPCRGWCSTANGGWPTRTTSSAITRRCTGDGCSSLPHRPDQATRARAAIPLRVTRVTAGAAPGFSRRPTPASGSW